MALDPEEQKREERFQAELARAEREAGDGTFGTLLTGWKHLVGPPLAAFVVAGGLLVFLPQAESPVTIAVEMIGLLGILYTLAIAGAKKAFGDPQGVRLWRKIAAGWAALAVLTVLILRL